jgi:hypothetical protein
MFLIHVSILWLILILGVAGDSVAPTRPGRPGRAPDTGITTPVRPTRPGRG